MTPTEVRIPIGSSRESSGQPSCVYRVAAITRSRDKRLELHSKPNRNSGSMNTKYVCLYKINNHPRGFRSDKEFDLHASPSPAHLFIFPASITLLSNSFGRVAIAVFHYVFLLSPPKITPDDPACPERMTFCSIFYNVLQVKEPSFDFSSLERAVVGCF